MLTIISGSNRKGNYTLIFAQYIYELIRDTMDIPVKMLDLVTIDSAIIHEAMYQEDQQAPGVIQIQNDYFQQAEKLWFFVPEYNGSYPGILKLLIDAISVRDYAGTFGSKKACVTGVASGRAGNLRGMDHLADVLNHLNIAVLPNKQPISSIHGLLDQHKKLQDKGMKEALQAQMDEFLKF